MGREQMQGAPIVDAVEPALGREGRIGGDAAVGAAPALGGWLLSLGLPPRQIFLSACLFAAIAAVATGLLALRGVRAEPLSGQSAA